MDWEAAATAIAHVWGWALTSLVIALIVAVAVFLLSCIAWVVVAIATHQWGEANPVDTLL